jgi:DnaK suppressor protein
MLKAPVLEKMKDILVQEKERLEKELAALGALNNEEAAYPEMGGNSEDDNAAEVTEYADEISLADRLRVELRDTVKALDAVVKGKYGICKYCGKEIDIKRLEARPTSSSCIDCKKSLTQEL